MFRFSTMRNSLSVIMCLWCNLDIFFMLLLHMYNVYQTVLFHLMSTYRYISRWITEKMLILHLVGKLNSIGWWTFQFGCAFVVRKITHNSLTLLICLFFDYLSEHGKQFRTLFNAFRNCIHRWAFIHLKNCIDWLLLYIFLFHDMISLFNSIKMDFIVFFCVNSLSNNQTRNGTNCVIL